VTELGSAARPPLSQQGEPVVVPTSFAEDRLWFLHELADGAPVYSVPIAARLRGRIDPGALSAALTAAAARHETLRCSFITDRGQPLKLVQPEPAVELETIPVESDPGPLLAELARLPFDLETPPLLRAYLLRVARDECVLLLNFHHLVVDNWSLDVLNAEVSSYYRELVEGAPPSLPSLPIQYADFAAWQREWVLTEPAAEQLEFWVERLADPPPPPPLRRGPEPAYDVTGHRQVFTIGWTLMRAVREAAAEAGATLFSFLLATYHLLLHAYTEEPDTLIGLPVAGRPTTEVESLIGFFVNTVVVRLDAPAGRRFTDHLQLTQREVAQALAHGDLPFQHVVKSVCADRIGASNPLFNVCFAYRPHSVPLDLPGVEASAVPVDTGTSTFDLTMLVEERQADAIGILEHAAAVDGALVARFAADYLRLLSAAATGGSERLDRLAASVRTGSGPSA
jgi:Condensation domain